MQREAGTLIREWFESLRTPVSTEARRLGYLYETIALQQRYRRQAASWKSHVEKCREQTLRAVDLSLPAHSRPLETMLILGSGPLIEVPMKELLGRFQKIVLVDFVHPLQVRAKWGREPRVHFVEADLLQLAPALLAWNGGALPEPQPLDLSVHRADFVLSANCLSQLPLKPRQHLQIKGKSEAGAEALDAFSEKLSRAHLQQIRCLKVSHLVIADFETRLLDREGKIIERSQPFFELNDLNLIESWAWALAPKGEIHRSHSVEMSVGAFSVK